MKQPLTEFWNYLFGEPDFLRCSLWSILLLLLASGVYGAYSIHRTRGRLGAARHAGLIRIARIPTWLGILAILLAVLHLALRQVSDCHALAGKGGNVTPADFAWANIETHLALVSGVLVGCLGLVLGWTFDWIVEGRRIATLREADAS